MTQTSSVTVQKSEKAQKVMLTDLGEQSDVCLAVKISCVKVF